MNHSDYDTTRDQCLYITNIVNHKRCPNTRLLADPLELLGFAVPGTLPGVVRLAIIFLELEAGPDVGVARLPLRE